MRIAYIGLSSPIGYDYKYPANKTKSDIYSSPNPVLESPFGLCLLFDEIWFVTRSLCPENMRDLSYVKFLDDEKLLRQMNHRSYNEILMNIRNDKNLQEKLNSEYMDATKRYSLPHKIISSILTNSAIDNHTHDLQIGNMKFRANPINIENFIFDLEMVNKINNGKIELITNSVTQGWFDKTNQFIKSKMTEQMIIGEIPNYLTSAGPYHPCIEEVRNDTFLKDFRKWIDTKSSNAEEYDIYEMVKLAQEDINKSRDEIFLQHLNPMTQYISIGKTLLGEFLGFIAPGLMPIANISEDLKTLNENKNKRWQGFVIAAKSTLKSKF